MASQRVRRALGAGAAALAWVSVIAIPSATPAQADDPKITLSIGAITPTTGQAGGVVTVSGIVTNSTSAPLTGTRVALWQSSTPLTDLAAFGAALAAEPTDTKGAIVAGSATSLLATGPLAPGGSASFSVSGTPTVENGAAYLMAVHVLDARGRVLARVRFVMGFGAAPQTGVLVVPLSAKPSQVTPAKGGDAPAPAVFLDDHLASDLRGRLGDLLELAETPGATALIDPALIDDLTAMAAGYQVAGLSGGDPTPGTGQEDAQVALARLQALADGGHAYRTLTANPDLDVLAALPKGSAIAAIAAALPSDHPLASLPLAVLTPGTTPSAQQVIAGLAPSLVVSTALQPTATVHTVGGIHWVAPTDVATLAALTGPTQTGRNVAPMLPALTRAARLVVAQAQGTPTVVLVGDDIAATTARTWLDEGWQPTPLAEVASAARAGEPTWRPNRPPVQPLPPDLAAMVAHVQHQTGQWADLGDGADDATAAARWLLPSALSASWNGDWGAAKGWLTPATTWLDDMVGTGAVELHVAPTWYLSSDNNSMPATIVNGMKIPVQVKVSCRSENPQRLFVPESELIKIQPGTAANVVVTPVASGNGSVQVVCSLLTAGGTITGRSAAVQVITTSAGRLGWVIIIGAGAAFVIATSLRVLQVRRHGRNRAQ